MFYYFWEEKRSVVQEARWAGDLGHSVGDDVIGALVSYFDLVALDLSADVVKLEIDMS